MLFGRDHLCRRRSAHAQQAALIVTSLVLQVWSVTAAADFGVPANLTIRDSTPYAVCLTWTLTGVGGGGGGRKGGQGTASPVQLQLIYRPVNASYRVVADLLGHRRSATLDNLRPETQYRLVMTSSVNGSLLGTSPVIFFHTPPTMPLGFVPSSYNDRTEMLSAEEIGIIVIVLGVWMMAIMLFFNRWGKIRMLEPYEYNFKYHHPIPEVATHRPSCPLADGAPLLQTSFERHCSLDRRLAPYGRRCSSLSAYLSAEPRMMRNNSDPAPPNPPGQPRPAGYRSSMQELRREATHCCAETPAAAAARQARHGRDSPVTVATGAGVGVGVGVAVAAGTGVAAGVGMGTGMGVGLVTTAVVGETVSAARASPTITRGSPASGRRETSREVGLTRGRSITAEERTPDATGSPRSLQLNRAAPERPRELLITRDPPPVDSRNVEPGAIPPPKAPEMDRRIKLTKPVRVASRDSDREPVRDSEV